MSGLKNIARYGLAISMVSFVASGIGVVYPQKTIDKKILGVVLLVSLFLIIIFGLSVGIMRRNDKFLPRYPSDPKWKDDVNLAIGEMNSTVVPRSEIEHQKGLVDWSPTFNGEECLGKDPATFVRQKKPMRPVGDFEKRQIATQRHSGRDGRSDQKPRNL